MITILLNRTRTCRGISGCLYNGIAEQKEYLPRYLKVLWTERKESSSFRLEAGWRYIQRKRNVEYR
jgi:hypothetical protein